MKLLKAGGIASWEKETKDVGLSSLYGKSDELSKVKKGCKFEVFFLHLLNSFIWQVKQSLTYWWKVRMTTSTVLNKFWFKYGYKKE